SYLLGAGAQPEPGASVRVVDQATGNEVGRGLPLQLDGLGNAVYSYDVLATDPAGNEAVWTVQVVAGTATQLPAGKFDLGVEARLNATDLLDPAQTIANGGGVCRDLAALYVSLLRGDGIPARLVAGYLSGRVEGFHAWVEFYGGTGHGPSAWVPVDVSGIDGP